MPDESVEMLNRKLDLLIETLARLAPRAAPASDLGEADCFVWSADPGYLDDRQLTYVKISQ